MILQKRDYKAIDMIELLNCARASQIARVCYQFSDSGEFNKEYIQIARARLKKMTKEKLVKRDRSNINYEYIYYKNKNNMWKHALTLTEFYTRLHEIDCVIDSFEVEKAIENIRPDATATIGYGGYTHHFFIEVQLSNAAPDYDKYIALYDTRSITKYYKVFPKILVICDRKLKPPPSPLRFIQLNTDCKDIEKIFER